MANIRNIAGLLDAIEESITKNEDLSLGDVLDRIGHRSFGPLLLIAGLVMAAPAIGDIPGVPTGTGIFVAVVAGQMLFRRKYIWMPQWLLKRTVSDRTVCKAIGWLRKPARHVDRMIRPRLTVLTDNMGAYAVAVACIGIAIATPAMEIVLFSANIAGAALAAYGLSLTAHDGVLALIAHSLTISSAAALIYTLL